MPSAITRSQFERYLTRATTIGVDALSSFDLFYSLNSPRHQKKYKEVFAKHTKVFVFVRPAIFSFLILSLFKLLDETRNAISIYRCISMAAQLSLISKEQKKVLTARINKVKPIWKKVCILRHQLIAHREQSMPASKFFEDATVSPKELRILALTYCDVFNSLMKAYGSKGFDPEEYSRHLFKNSEIFLDDLLIAA